MKTKWMTILFFFAAGVFIGRYAYEKLLEAGAVLSQGRRYYDLPRSATATFVLHGTGTCHVTSYFVSPRDTPPGPAYSLQITFVAASGEVREQRVAYLSIETTAEPSARPGSDLMALPKGDLLAQPRMLPLLPPPDARVLIIRSLDGRVLLQVRQLDPRPPVKEHVRERADMSSSWLATDEVQALPPYRFAPLPAMEELEIIRLPFKVLRDETTLPLENTSAPPPMALNFGPHHALVFNVVGPGTLTAALDPAGGRAQLQHIGPKGSATTELKDGRNAVKLPSGPSSVIIQPLSESLGSVRVTGERLHALGRTDQTLEPALRPVAAWHAVADRPLRFPMFSGTPSLRPVRLTAHAMQVPAANAAPVAMHWDFMDAHGRELQGGVIPLQREFDPFAEVKENNVASVDARKSLFPGCHSFLGKDWLTQNSDYFAAKSSRAATTADMKVSPPPWPASSRISSRLEVQPWDSRQAVSTGLLTS